MKKLIILFSITILSSQILYATVTIDGYAYLENQTNHSGIEVLFERIAPSGLTYTVYTNARGYYTIEIETGIYNVTFSKTDYFNVLLYDEYLYANTTLSDSTLL